jgi:Bifunctional DNA primase/polymerase, N-terminal
MTQTGSFTPIIDPTNPPRLFDGKLEVQSTCRYCGKLMTIIHADERSHPTCPRVETQLESLATLWVSEVEKGDDAQANMTEQLMKEVAILDIGTAAHEFTRWAWPVFPLAEHSKKPAIPKPKGKGFKDATTDTARIDKWWTKHPTHNIGLATGHLFDVIDIDTKDSDGKPSPVGVQSFMALMDAGDIPEVHGVAVTASGGMHLYVLPTGRGNFAGVRPGIDYRGLGGYVVAPPSALEGVGRGYSWLTAPSPIIKGDNT